MTPQAPARRPRPVRAAVFDTDGVITDTATTHATAWKAAFDAHLGTGPHAGRVRPFDPTEDYLRYVDGKSRLDGAAAFLTARGLRPSAAEVEAVAAAKERLFTQELRERGATALPGAVRLLHALRGAGTPIAVVSASRHAREVLAAAGVLDLFHACVDGTEAARLGLPGKPDPALFLEAARRLGVPPAACAVVEDALAGVEAGRRGGFGLVAGVDRTAGPDTADALRRAGADVVVRDPAELLAALTAGVPS
ncbi:HAD family hydrolase [Streptomyces sp. NPDC015131]|uniref:HAD family hydrolase n=1 Tax=Streptomyces sp. NPDC015131 TaxID=3364941 RepID=UPI0036F79DBF